MRRRVGIAVLAWVVGLAVFRLALVPAEACGDVNAATLDTAIADVRAWLERAQQPDGTYLYEYDRSTDTFSPSYNIVRHAGVTMAFYQIAAGGDPSTLAGGDRGMAFMIDNLVFHDDRAVLSDQGAPPELGSTSLMLAGLTHRRLATGDTQHDELMHALTRAVIHQQRANGGFLNVVDPSGDPVPNKTSLFSNGEAFWALLLAHAAFPQAGYDQSARRAADYIATEQDEEENVFFQPWASQWSAYGYADMLNVGLTEEHIAYSESLINRFGAIIRGGAQRRSGGLAALVRKGAARGTGFGTVLEGTASMNRLASAHPSLMQYRERLEDRMRCAAGLVISAQHSADEAATYPQPDLVEGAWFVDDVTRMDDQQHHLSGLLATRAFLYGGPQ